MQDDSKKECKSAVDLRTVKECKLLTNMADGKVVYEILMMLQNGVRFQVI